MMTMTRSTFIKMMEMLTGTGTRVRLEGLIVEIGGISFLRMSLLNRSMIKGTSFMIMRILIRILSCSFH